MRLESIKFENNKLIIIDQTLLPAEVKFLEINTLEQAVNAIKTLKIRGAPAIGIMAAYSLFVVCSKFPNLEFPEFWENFLSVSRELVNSRPTAVNLKWAVGRIQNQIEKKSGHNTRTAIETIKSEAVKIHAEDRESCQKIGLNGAELIHNSANILTICNTGALATGGWGTALGVVYAAHQQNKRLHVYACETRPLGQGARLTLWELIQNKIPATLITDSTAASLMAQGKIDLVIFGADRIAANGDTANKIGSYNLAVAAYFHQIPCFVAAPFSTFDLSLSSGAEIPIELRNPNEIIKMYNYGAVPEGSVYNPAFDVTPAKLISGIITEYGILRQPLNISIFKTFNEIPIKEKL